MQWPLLTSLTEQDRDRMLTSARRRKFKRGETVFHEGDPGDSLHLIAGGRFAVRVLTPDGDSATLNIVGAGGFFGELALLRDDAFNRRTATIIALEPSETLSITGAAFQTLCQQHPKVERLVTGMLAQRVHDLSQRLLETLYLGVDRRVYRRLLELADIYGPGASIIIPLTQDDIAGMAGTTRPTVNQVLQKLAGRGVVVLGRGQIEILDHAALRAYAPDIDE